MDFPWWSKKSPSISPSHKNTYAENERFCTHQLQSCTCTFNSKCFCILYMIDTRQYYPTVIFYRKRHSYSAFSPTILFVINFAAGFTRFSAKRKFCLFMLKKKEFCYFEWRFGSWDSCISLVTRFSIFGIILWKVLFSICSGKTLLI